MAKPRVKNNNLLRNINFNISLVFSLKINKQKTSEYMLYGCLESALTIKMWVTNIIECLFKPQSLFVYFLAF